MRSCLPALPLVVRAGLAWCALGAGCSDEVDCEALCERTLACEVSFAPRDDLDGDKVRSGERSDLESCTLGCADSEYVTSESVACLEAVDEPTAAACQSEMLACVGVDELE